MAFKSQPQLNTFPDVFVPPHPHRRIHILWSILACVIVFASITFYGIHKVTKENKEEAADQTEAQKLAQISQSLATPQVTPEFEAKLRQISKSLAN